MFVLFDQDTQIGKDFLKNGLKYINDFKSKELVCVYAPIHYNNVTSSYGSHINLSKLSDIINFRKQYSKKNYEFPDYVISSGSFIPLKAYEIVGEFNNNFFIDFIDIEWCLRAKNFKLFAVSLQRIKVSHNIGDKYYKIFSKKYPIHSPERMYYYFRNSFYMYVDQKINFNWKIVDSSRNILRIFFYVFLIKPRLRYLKCIFKGIISGLTSKFQNAHFSNCN